MVARYHSSDLLASPPTAAQPAVGPFFRFSHRSSVFIFTSDGIVIFHTYYPKRIRYSFGLLGLAIIGIAILGASQRVDEPYAMVGVFLLTILFAILALVTSQLQGRKNKELTAEELVSHKSEYTVTDVPWSEVRSLELGAGNMLVHGGRGLRKWEALLKFDQDRFNELGSFLTPRLGDRLAVAKSVDVLALADSWQQNGEPPPLEAFARGLRRVVTMAILGSASLVTGAYFFYAFLVEFHRYLLGFPPYLPYAVIAFAGAGYCIWIATMLAWRRALKVLERIDPVRFKNAHTFPRIPIVMLCLISITFFLMVYFYPASVYNLPTPQNAFPVLTVLQMAGWLTQLFVAPVAIFFFVISVVLMIRGLGPLPGKSVHVVMALLFSASLLSVLLAYALSE